jgi:hypothetical protein
VVDSDYGDREYQSVVLRTFAGIPRSSCHCVCLRVFMRKRDIMYVNGQYLDISVQDALKGAEVYGGTLSDGTWDIIDLLTEVFITFPNMHSAASWAEAYEVSDKVNIAFHGTKLSDKWTVRYVF